MSVVDVVDVLKDVGVTKVNSFDNEDNECDIKENDAQGEEVDA